VQYIFSQAFHQTPYGHVWKITVEERFEPQNLELFDPAAQELYRLLPATIFKTGNMGGGLCTLAGVTTEQQYAGEKSEPRDAIQAQPGRVTACNQVRASSLNRVQRWVARS
jgi:hypothetical protein